MILHLLAATVSRPIMLDPIRSGPLRLAPTLLIALATILTGCGLVRVFYELPDEQAVKAANDEITWQGHREAGEPRFSEEIVSFDDLVRTAVAPDFHVYAVGEERRGKMPALPSCGVAAEFLHLSDAQVRDEHAYKDAPSKLRFAEIDPVVSVTVRRPTVEECDNLTLAAFLVAYGKARQAAEAPRGFDEFAVHTGDLLDISLMTEMMETMDVFRLVRGHYEFPLYSIAGNHDGLTFGNINDEQSDTRGLGINRHEFVLAHQTTAARVEYDEAKTHPTCPADVEKRCDQTPGHQAPLEPRFAFGFGRNEIYRHHGTIRATMTDDAAVARLDALTCAGAGEAMRTLTAQIDEAEEARCIFLEGCIEPSTLTNPTVYRDLVHVSGRVDQNAPVSMAYYSWLGVRSSACAPQLRFIALDTRSKDGASGRMDLVQLAWLHNELREALCQNQAVVLFAHHSPAEVRPVVLRRILDRFPNIIGYFYGHGHVNREAVWRAEPGRFALIQTGSITDYPQMARRVRIQFDGACGCGTQPMRATIDWEFLRPEGTRTDRGRKLDAYLHAANDDSFQEYRSTLFHGRTGPWREWLHAVIPMVSRFDAMTQAEYRERELNAGPMSVSLSFEPWRGSDPNTLFGTRRRRKTDEVRRLLSLPVMREGCDVDGR